MRIRKDFDKDKLFFTSDTHFGHENIIKFCNRPFKDANEMNQQLIENWNSVVPKDGVVFHLGDVALGIKSNQMMEIFHALHGTKYLIRGNHEKVATGSAYLKDLWEGIYDIAEIKIKDEEITYGEQHIVMCHYPMISWAASHRGSWQLFGHCISKESEILTSNGWKSYNTIRKDDLVYSENKEGEIVLGEINEIIFNNYWGESFSLSARSVNMNVTEKHKIISYSRYSMKRFESTADLFFNSSKRKTIRVSGVIKDESKYDISSNLLKLYIFLAADGNIKESTKLCRIMVKKLHKIKYLRFLLKELSLDFRELPQKDGVISFNFTMPVDLQTFKIKGLDEDLILNLNKEQTLDLLDAYRNSDGRKESNTFIIYTSKLEEVELLQHLFVTRGFMCTKHSRVHGFSSNTSYTLTVTEKQFVDIDVSNSSSHKSQGDLFWCINTKHGNFFTRLKGKVHLTGNCHGGLNDKSMLSSNQIDVGVDCHNFTPISYEEVKKIITLNNLAV